MKATRFKYRPLISCVLLIVIGISAPQAHADLLVASRLGSAILAYDETTGAFLRTFASDPSLDGPAGMTFGPDGNLYVSSNFANSVVRFNGTTGEFIDNFASGSGLARPTGVTFGSDGNLYVSSRNPTRILQFDGSTGNFSGIFASGGGLLKASIGLVFGPDGNLYVTNISNNGVIRFDGVTGAPLPSPGQTGGNFIPPGSGELFAPGSLTFGPDGDLYVTSSGTSKVLRYDGTSGDFLDVFASGGGLMRPTGLVFGPDGNLYVSSRDSSAVLRYNGMSGEFMDVFVTPGSGTLDAPTSLLFTPYTSGAAVPEPSTLVLLAVGALGLGCYRLRRSKLR